MANVLQLRCSVCGRVFSPDEVQYTCPVDGQIGTLDVLYDYEALKAHIDRDSPRVEPSLWRYRDLLPLAPDAAVPPLRVGWTPLYHTPRLAADLGVGQAWGKDDGLNPTGSLKDRASALIVARAVAAGIRVVST